MDKTETIAKYAEMMARLPYDTGENPRILLKHEDRCYETAAGADFSSIEASDIADVTDFDSIEKDVLMASKETNAMVISKPPYIGICIDSRKTIRAVLDDMAQIVGRQVRVVPYTTKDIAKALKSAEAVMIRGGYVITCGRNLYEAYVAMTVLEKSAEVLLKSAVLGGSVPLSTVDANLMRQVYKRKYSKAEKEHKDDSEG
ncbi:class II aldolase/adducin family protein [Aminicella lysinilytica]|uniref:class II aldolase/adducin family protein n=1 Tax=Aminicella lysinilytica TaxID=433323 RepID=UPI0026F3169C|nr:class II aldolase/adducin family protein [Aminicella lysinilytica]